MANELSIIYTGSNPIYSIIRRTSDAKVWNGTTFVTWVDLNVATYDIPLVDKGGDFFASNFPTTISTGIEYALFYYEQLGATPATTDTLLSSKEGYWNGIDIVSVYSSTSSTFTSNYNTSNYCQVEDVELLLPQELYKKISSPIPDLQPRLSSAKITSYIERADQIINNNVQQYYAVPLRRIKIVDPNLVADAESSNYPYPIPIVSARIAASLIYNEVYTGDGGHVDGSEYGKQYWEKAFEDLDKIQSGVSILIGQIKRGERYRRPESMRIQKFNGYKK